MSVELVFVTGISGAGKTTALKMMEDLGYYCVDNLPISLIGKFVELSVEGAEGRLNRVAMGVDIRSGESLKDIRSAFDGIRNLGVDIRVLFLDADNRTLIKRFKESRRSHPLAAADRLESGIEMEREALAFLKKEADYIIDTSQLLTRDLRVELERIFIEDSEFKSLMITVLSFGFKNGIPADADLVFDVRFLPNPYYVPELRDLTGKDSAVRDFVMQFEVARQFTEKLVDLIRFLIPNYIEEGKNQLVITVGCTGGRHRSVTLAEEVFEKLKGSSDYGLRIEHRDITADAEAGRS